MVLPLILGALGGALGTAGTLGTVGALGGAAIGSGLGTYAQTGDLEKGIAAGLGAYAGGTLLAPIMGGAGAAAAANPSAAAGSLTGQAAAAAPAAAAPYATAVPGPGVTGLGVPKPASAITAGTPKGLGGIAGLGRGAMRFARSPMGGGTSIGASVGSSLVPSPPTVSSAPAPQSASRAAPPPQLQGEGSSDESRESELSSYGFLSPSIPGIPTIGRMAMGGIVRRMQDGGIASLAPQGAGRRGAAVPPELGNDKEIVANAIRAIKGKSDRAEIALGAFLARYGEAALRDLVDSVRSESKRDSEDTDDMDDDEDEGRVTGPGDGMSDMVPANIENDEDVLLSDGEFVISADVVSALGNGSSDAGAKALQNMMDRVRSMKNGSPKQPPRIPQEKMLPA